MVHTESALDPSWVYHGWDPAEEKQVVLQDAPLKHAQRLRMIDSLLEHLPREGVLARFSTPKELQEKYEVEVIPFNLTLSLRGSSSELCHQALKALSGCAAMKLQGVRLRPERIQKPPLTKALEAACLAVPYCDWSRGRSMAAQVEAEGVGPLFAAAHEGVRLCIREGLSLTRTRLLNRSNLCYVNSVLQAAHWSGELSSGVAAYHGRLLAGMRIFHATGTVSVADSLPLRGFLLDGRKCTSNMMQVTTQSAAYRARWDARDGSDDCAVDSGTLEHAIILPIAGAPVLTLQSLLDNWHQQTALHALVVHPVIIWFQLERYLYGSAKCTRQLRMRPGDQVAVPIFSNAAGLDTHHESFTAAVMAYHMGETVNSGHYMTFLGLPGAIAGTIMSAMMARFPRLRRLVTSD